jgi:hypothetical protein
MSSHLCTVGSVSQSRHLQLSHADLLGPLKISLEKAHKVICPQKNNLPHFKISGTLIVKMRQLFNLINLRRPTAAGCVCASHFRVSTRQFLNR